MPISLTLKNLFLLLLFIQFSPFSTLGLTGGKENSEVPLLTIADGLSNNSVTAIFQDHYGFLWIGTEDGLNRYDGYQFITYRHNPGVKNSISGNHIQCITQDEENNLWIGTHNSGLNKFDYSTGTFTSYLTNANSDSSLPENSVYGIFVDKKGDLWVKTQSYLSAFKGDSLGFENYGHFNNVFNVQEASKYPMLTESDTSLLVGTKDGLNRFNTETKHFSRLGFKYTGENPTHEVILDLIPMERNTSLMASSAGLRVLEYSGNGKMGIKNVSDNSSGVNVVLRLESGEILAGTPQGIHVFEYSTTDQRLSVVEKVLESYNVISLFEDQSGIIWAGTRFNGLLKINPAPSKFKKFFREGENNGFGNSLNVKSIFQDNDGSIWMGTMDSGILKYDPSDDSTTGYEIICESGKHIEPHTVFVLYLDETGRLWAGTNCGLYYLNKAEQRFVEFDNGLDFGIENLIKTNHILSLATDLDGNMWIGTGFGLYRFDGRYIFSHFFDQQEVSGLYSDHINALLRDEKGNLWIGTSGGLNVWDRDTKQILRVPFIGEDSSAIRTSVLSLEFAYNGEIWAGTQSGLWKLDPEDRKPQSMEGNHNLENDMIQAVSADHANRAWVSTNKGISCVNPDGTVFNFDVVDGLPGYGFNNNSVFKNREGTLIFGSTQGICWFHPDSINYNLHKPSLAITNIQLVRRGKKAESFWPFTEGINLKYRFFTSLEVEFSALEFTQPEKNHYRVFLEGYDSEWRPVTKENKVSFSNLLPGDYTLKIIASNNDFTWNNDPLKLDITVNPPLWMSNYAFAFYILALIFILHLFVSYRVRHYKKVNKELQEKTVNKKQIEAQREVLTHINRSLTDSINYARRIQRAMIPSEASFSKVFSQSFVYLRARDIVSGDFFWFHEKEDKVFVAAVDCTGHGVPGAFMSIIGIDLLKNIVEVQGVESPSEILKTMNGDLIRTLNRQQQTNGNENDINDGMDMSLVVIDRKKKMLEFAGAYNGFYLIRDNEIHSYKGDRFPIGYLKDGESPVFTCKEVPLKDDDAVYLFSDGLPDQFGGPDYKKFKYRRFRLLLLHIHQMGFFDQKTLLHQKIEEWMGEGNEQVDDMLIIGFKPLGKALKKDHS